MFEFSEEHKMLRQMIRRWATAKLEPKVSDLEAGEPPYELIRDLARSFRIADTVTEAFARMEARASKDGADGANQRMGGLASSDPALSALFSIELSRICPGFMLAFGASMGLAGGSIMSRGTLEQKRRWGLPLLTCEKIGAWGMTEPGAGSDAFGSMRTVARPRGEGYVLDGQKTFITNAPYADIVVVYAKLDLGDGSALADRAIQAFIVERGDRGISLSKPMKKMGMHASPTGEVFLADCYVAPDRLLGGAKETIGRSSGRDVFHVERTGMAPMAVGIIERCLEVSIAYAKQRVTWGRSISEYQLVQEKLARMYVHLQNCENLLFKQLARASAGKPITAAEASATKLYCARAATECALEAVQILGGNGYMHEYQVEMLARDAKLLQIGGGTDEIQIINIARHLLAAGDR